MSITTDNSIQSLNWGRWQFCLYNPEADIYPTPIEGFLIVGKDFHIVYIEEGHDRVYAGRFPSPNVAYVINLDVVSLTENPAAKKTRGK